MQGKSVRRSKKAAWRVFDNQGVVLETQSSRIFGLNGTGAVLWELLGEEKIFDDLVVEFAGKVGQAPAVVAPDVREFLNALQGRGLIDVA